MRFSGVLTSEQARILFDLVKANRALITGQWSPGICDGLLYSLMHIDRGGGALLRGQPTAIEYGGDIIDATIIPASAYIAWPGTKTAPRPYWDLAAMLPDVDRRSVTVYRATNPLAVVPLAASVVPAHNPVGVLPLVQSLRTAIP